MFYQKNIITLTLFFFITLTFRLSDLAKITELVLQTHSNPCLCDCKAQVFLMIVYCILFQKREYLKDPHNQHRVCDTEAWKLKLGNTPNLLDVSQHLYPLLI